MKIKARTNINTIARQAGVSTTTVSNFINGTETFPISPGKQKKIMQVMRRLKYRPSPASSQLRRKSGLPGNLVFIYGNHPTSNPFATIRNPALGEMLSILDEVARQKLNLSLQIRAVADESRLDSWNETIADAAGVLCYGRLDQRLHDLTTRRNIPLVLVSDHLQTSQDPLMTESLDLVYWDAASHLQMAFELLRSLGAKRIAFVSSWNTRQNHPEGYALEAEAKIERFRTLCESTPQVTGEIFSPPKPENTSAFNEEENVHDFLHPMGKKLETFDAIIGHNDLVARGIYSVLRERDFIVPRDILLLGEGDYEDCRHRIPGLTTTSYDRTYLAEKACEVLAARLADNQPKGHHHLIPSRLILKETNGALFRKTPTTPNHTNLEEP